MANEEKKKASDFEKHINAVDKKLKKFLARDLPPDVLIIKAHLICEYYINQVLILKEVCTANELNNLTFAVKNEKAFAGGIPADKKRFDYLKTLNKLRNKVGHELEYSISESDIDQLGYIQGKSYVLGKYNFEELPELLRDTLSTIVITVAVRLLSLVESEKKKEKTLPE